MLYRWLHDERQSRCWRIHSRPDRERTAYRKVVSYWRTLYCLPSRDFRRPTSGETAQRQWHKEQNDYNQAAIRAVDSTLIKSKTTQKARDELHELGKDNNVLLRWIPAHKGFLGNEKADELAKRGSGDNEAQDVTLPVPRTAWRNALRQRSHRKMRDRLKDMPPHFRTVWRPSHTKSLSNLGKNKLRAATQYLTGHCELNYHLNKYRPQNISKICPHCSMEEETMNHFIGQCPMWFNRKGRFFNCYYKYTSISEVADRIPPKNIVGYICSTNRFNQQ